MDYFNHNERKTQRPLAGRPDFVNPDFDTDVTASHGIIVQETCGATTVSPLAGDTLTCGKPPGHAGLHRHDDTRGTCAEWRQ